MVAIRVKTGAGYRAKGSDVLTGLGNRALSGIPLVAVAYAVAHRACGLSMAFEGRDKNNIDQYKTGGSGTKSMAIICQYRS
jgi:hypothetical protein